jgi:hypothetical protein
VNAATRALGGKWLGLTATRASRPLNERRYGAVATSQGVKKDILVAQARDLRL